MGEKEVMKVVKSIWKYTLLFKSKSTKYDISKLYGEKIYGRKNKNI